LPKIRKPKPRKTLPVPVDSSRASLFDTAYIHPWLRKSNLLWVYYNWYVKAILWVTTGTTHGLDQWVGGITHGLEDADKSKLTVAAYGSILHETGTNKA
jgi:dimethylaniline monooxygenase (N-oxide forming)